MELLRIELAVEVGLQLRELSQYGSSMVPGFMNPEGIMIYHTHSKRLFKVTLDNDGHKEAKK